LENVSLCILHRYCEDVPAEIQVHKKDADFQRILWHKDPSDEVRKYCLLMVIYGITSACLAIRILLQLASDEERRLPRGALAMREYTYVNDVLTSGNNLEDTLKVKAQTKQLL